MPIDYFVDEALIPLDFVKPDKIAHSNNKGEDIINLHSSEDMLYFDVREKEFKGAKFNIIGKKADLIVFVNQSTSLESIDFSAFENVLFLSKQYIKTGEIINTTSFTPDIDLKLKDIKANNMYLYTYNATLIDIATKGILQIMAFNEASLKNVIVAGSNIEDALSIISLNDRGKVARMESVRAEKGSIYAGGFDVIEYTEIGCLKDVIFKPNNQVNLGVFDDTLRGKVPKGKFPHHIYISGKDSTYNAVIYPFIIPEGIFEIRDGMKVEFKTFSSAKDNIFKAREFILHLLDSKDDKVIIPGSLYFDKVNVKSSGRVNFEGYLKSREIHIENSNIIHFGSLEAHQLTYKGDGSLLFDICTLKHLYTQGKNTISFDKRVCIDEIDSRGQTNLFIQGDAFIGKISLNLDLKGYSPDIFGIHIIPSWRKEAVNIEIGIINARLAVFEVKLPAKIHKVRIDPAGKGGNLFNIDPSVISKVVIDEFIASVDLAIDPETGAVYIKSNDSSRMIGSAAVYADFNNVQVNKYMIISAFKTVFFNGGRIGSVQAGVNVEQASLFKSSNEDVILTGKLKAKHTYVMAPEGEVINSGFNLETSLIRYSARNIYIIDSGLDAQKILMYAMYGKVAILDSKLHAKAEDIVIVNSEGDIFLHNSNLHANNFVYIENKDGIIFGSEISGDKIVLAIKKFILHKSNIFNKEIILLNEHLHEDHDRVEASLGVDLPSLGIKILSLALEQGKEKLDIVKVQGSKGISISGSNFESYDSKFNASANLNVHSTNIAMNNTVSRGKDISIAGTTVRSINSSTQGSNSLSIEAESLVIRESNLDGKKVYINIDNGLIQGSSLSGDEYLVIHVKNNLEVLPLNLHNAMILGGGYNDAGFRNLLSQLNAGLLEIKVGNVATFLGTIMNAAQGRIEAGYLNMLSKDKVREMQVKRIDELAMFNSSELISYLADTSTLATELNFSEVTSIFAKKSRVDVNYPYKSKVVELRQGQGNIVIDRNLHYDQLILRADSGSIMMSSKELSKLYPGKQALSDNRISIGGNSVFLIADSVDIEGGVINVRDKIKIVTKTGVHILPIAVHSSYVKNMGKYKESGRAVEQVISELNAGIIEISSEGIVEVVAALCEATNIDIRGKEIKILSAKEIFDNQVSFRGAFKLFKGRTSWTETEHIETNIKTLLNAKKISLIAKEGIGIEGNITNSDNFTVYTEKGDIVIKNVQDIYVKDRVTKKTSLFSFEGGMLKIGSTKTVKEEFYAKSVQPTIIHAAGQFYGYSGGKFITLGSKIVSGKIVVEAVDDVILEAAPGYEGHFIKVTEQGSIISLNSSNGKYGVKAGVFYNEQSKTLNKVDWTNTELIGDSIQIKAKTLIQKGANFTTESLSVIAKDWIIQPVYNEAKEENSTKEIFLGFFAGVKTAHGALTNKLEKAASNDNDKPVGMANTLLDLIAAKRELIKLMNTKNLGVRTSVSGTLEAHAQNEYIQTKELQANLLEIGKLVARIDDQVLFEGVHFTGQDADIVAKRFTMLAGVNSREVRTESIGFELSVDLRSGVIENFGFSRDSHEASEQAQAPNFIKLSGKFKLNVKEGKIISSSIEADITDIKADSLIVKSVQDIIKHRGYGFNVSFDPSKIGSSLTGALSSIYGDKRDGDSKITKQVASIIGRSALQVIVKDTLEISGGLIANAERGPNGELTDKGKANIQAGNLIVNKLVDYDQGVTLGLGFAPTDKADWNPYGDAYRVKTDYKDKTRDVHSIIGQGQVTVGGQVIDVYKEINVRSLAQGNSEMRGPEISFDVEYAATDAAKEQAAFKSGIENVKTVTKATKSQLAQWFERAKKGESIADLIRKPYHDEPEYKENDEHEESDYDVDEDDIKENEPTSTKAKPKPKTEEIPLTKEETEALKKAIAQKFSSLPKEKQEELLAYFKGTYQQIKKDPEKFAVLVEAGRPLLASAVVIPQVLAEVASLTTGALAASGLVSILAAGSIITGGAVIYIYRNEIIDGIQSSYKYLDKVIIGNIRGIKAVELQQEDINEQNYENSKHGSKDKKQSKSNENKVTASSTNPPPDDDDDQEENNNQNSKLSFNPGKEGNYDEYRTHPKYGKFYSKPGSKGKIWYSKEISGKRGHGGPHWKEFVKQGGDLILEAEIDMQGNIMKKNPGKLGIRIKWKDLAGGK